MNILFLDKRARIQPFIDHAEAQGYNVHFYDGQELDFMPDHIINGKDNKAGLEYDLIQRYHPQTYFDSDARDFFMSKTRQDEVCREIGIPVIPNVSPKVIVKVDNGQSGGEGAYICDRDEAGEGFVQDFMEINHVISAYIYADNEGQWHILTYGRMDYEDNRPSHYHAPHFPGEHIASCVSKLNRRLTIRNRIFFWQFLNGTYHMDFNCRPSGSTEKGTFDTGIGNYSFAQCLLEGALPDEIRYHSRIRLEYFDGPQFGHGSCHRFRIPLIQDSDSGRYEEVATREAVGTTIRGK